MKTVKALNIAGWAAYVLGSALWCYGYFVGGTPSIVDWPSISPTWISTFVPNIEAEAGMLLMCLGMLPQIWIAIRVSSKR